MARTPKGSILRSIPDFYPERMMMGSAFVGTVSNFNYAAVALYNNASDGSLLVLWDFSIGSPQPNSTTGPFVIRMLMLGSSIGGGTNPGYPLVSGGPTLPGQINYINPFTNPHGEQASFVLTNFAYNWAHEWPAAVIKPGYSLAMVTDFNACVGLYASFMWEVVRHV